MDLGAPRDRAELGVAGAGGRGRAGGHGPGEAEVDDARDTVGVDHDIFCLVHAWPARRVLELAPVYWILEADSRALQAARNGSTWGGLAEPLLTPRRGG